MRNTSKVYLASLVLSLLALTACGSSTPEYGIFVDGSNALSDVDTAWGLAAQLAKVDAHDYAKKAGELSFDVQSTPITVSGVSTQYHGLSNNSEGFTQARVQLVGDSLLDVETPSLHEFMHSMLFLRDGNEDDSHSAPEWACANLDYSTADALDLCMNNHNF